MTSAGSRKPKAHVSSEHPAPAWSCSGAPRWVGGTWRSPDLGILWPWLLVRGGSPSLQTITSTPKRGAATLCEMFISLNIFAEPYLASAGQLHGRGVSELPRCNQSAALEHSLLSPSRRDRGGGRCIPSWGGKRCTNTSSEEWRNRTGGPQPLSDGQVGPHYWSWR